MQDNLIRSGNAFFAPVGDNRYKADMVYMKDNIGEKASDKYHENRHANENSIDNTYELNSEKHHEKPHEHEHNHEKDNNRGKVSGDYKTGSLPENAPLGAAYVPWQRSAEPVYDSDEALTRGTLFPGLDLPFMDIANKNNPYAGTHLGDLMAIGFVTHELALYLDTHPKDKEAFALMQKMLRLEKEAHSRFVKMHGPISKSDLLDADSYTWVHGPWPWETPAPGSSLAHENNAEGK